MTYSRPLELPPSCSREAMVLSSTFEKRETRNDMMAPNKEKRLKVQDIAVKLDGKEELGKGDDEMLPES